MCGIFGIIRKPASKFGDRDMKKLMRGLGIGAEVRGIDATGIAYVDPNTAKMKVVKAPLRASQFPFYKSMPDGIDVVIGHTRATTQGSEAINRNNHPFLGETLAGQKFALAHNGILWNDYTLKRKHELKYKIETDTYVAVALLNKQLRLDFDTVKEVAEELEGSFMLTILTDSNDMWFIRNDNPIHVIEFRELGLIVYASTEDIVLQGIKNVKHLYRYYKKNKAAAKKVSTFSMKDGSIHYYNYKEDYWVDKNFEPCDSYFGWTKSYTRGYTSLVPYAMDYDSGYEEWYEYYYGGGEWFKDKEGKWEYIDGKENIWEGVTFHKDGSIAWEGLWFADDNMYITYRGYMLKYGKTEADDYYVETVEKEVGRIVKKVDKKEEKTVCLSKH